MSEYDRDALTMRIFTLKSRNGVVDIATMPRAGQHGVRVPVGAKDFSLPQQLPGRPWGPSFLLFNVVRGAYPEIKRPDREIKLFLPFNHSSPSSVADNITVVNKKYYMCT